MYKISITATLYKQHFDIRKSYGDLMIGYGAFCTWVLWGLNLYLSTSYLGIHCSTAGGRIDTNYNGVYELYWIYHPWPIHRQTTIPCDLVILIFDYQRPLFFAHGSYRELHCHSVWGRTSIVCLAAKTFVIFTTLFCLLLLSSLLRGRLRPALRPSINCSPMRNPDHNQRLGKSISRSYELERMHL